MVTKPKFKSDAFAAIHSSARALHKVGAVSKSTLREFNESCLAAPGGIKPKPVIISPNGDIDCGCQGGLGMVRVTPKPGGKAKMVISQK